MEQSNSLNAARPVHVAFRIAGIGTVSFGAYMAVFGSNWASRTMQVLSDNPLGPVLGLFAPFLPIFLMLFGAYLLTNTRRRPLYRRNPDQWVWLTGS